MILQPPASGPALTNRVKHILLLSVSLCLMSACADRTEPTVSGRAVGEVLRDAPRVSGGAGPEMAALPGKGFRMGDVSGGGEEDEQPVRAVRMDRPIAISKYEVAFEEYGRFASLAGAARPDDKGWGAGKWPGQDERRLRVSRSARRLLERWPAASAFRQPRLELAVLPL